VAIAVLAIAGCSGSSPDSSVTSPAVSCATADGAYLDVAHPPLSGSFETIVDQRFRSSPLGAFHYGPVPASDLAVSEWRAERLHGWIAVIAVTGPDRPSEDRYAESLKYTVGRFPLVPLVGPVVQHNSGILEVYQTNTEYEAGAGASSYMKELAASAQQSQTSPQTDNGTVVPPPVPVRIAGGGVSVALETPQYVIPHVGPTERFFSFSVQFGRYVLQLSVQGGDHLDPDTAIGVLNAAAMRLTQSCALPSVTFHLAS
jgi:hypothetical protein